MKLRFLLLISLHLVVWLPTAVSGCFPKESVFKLSTIWSQDLRIPWRRIYAICQESQDVMKVEFQQPHSNVITQTQVTCLKTFSGHRYLVKVEGQGQGKPTLFQCLRFTPLTTQVVRRALTPLQLDETKVNCETDRYVEDEELMIAYRTIRPQACPLSGGFQILLDGGASVGPHCRQSVRVYNPSLQFACGGKHIQADFGGECSPIVPIQSQGPYRLSLLYLQCVDSWDESGEEEVKAMLLQSLSDSYTYWCLHYKPVRDGNGHLFNIHLSFRGKCGRNVFNRTQQDTPDEYSTFGSLARYVPASDSRCHTATTDISLCRAVSLESECFETSECPYGCQRCNTEIAKHECPFTHAIGRWTGRDYGDDLVVDVNTHGFSVTGFGIFSCFGSTKSQTQGDVHLVVRNDPDSSCFPFYVCAKLSSPTAGVLNVFMKAAERDSLSGEPSLNCKPFPYGPRIIIPSQSLMITLLNKENIRTVPCNIPNDMLFASGLGRCQFGLKQCSGACTTLRGNYDLVSCGNGTRDEIDHEHTCRAKIQLVKGIQGIITRSVMTNTYRCWIFINQRELYITEAEKCNSEAVKLMLMERRTMSEYLPVQSLSLTVEEKVNIGTNTGSMAAVYMVVSIVTFALWVLP